MIKYFLPAVFLFATSQVLATELTPANLVGRYNVEAQAGFQKIYVTVRVLNTSSFEFQRTYPDGQKDELCDGTYGLASSFIFDGAQPRANKTFKGKMTCPSDRSKKIDFNILFHNTTLEDLIHGTNVIVTSSLAPGMQLNAYVKKQ